MSRERSSGIRIDAELAERARDACVHLGVAFSSFVEDAIERSLRRIERSKGPIPRRPDGSLRAGRRQKPKDQEKPTAKSGRRRKKTGT